MKMKKIITSLICSASILSVTLPTASTVSASTIEDENNSNEVIVNQGNNEIVLADDETVLADDENEFVYENYEISYVEEDGVVNITVRDLETNEISTAEVITETEEIIVDGEEFNTFAINASAVYTSGVIKTKFNINPTSVASAIATIAAMASIIASLGASGIGIATFKTAASKALATIGTGTTLERLFKNASLNGWFQYQQERSGSKARNINRKLYLRVGSSASYAIHNFGTGGWFSGTRP